MENTHPRATGAESSSSEDDSSHRGPWGHWAGRGRHGHHWAGDHTTRHGPPGHRGPHHGHHGQPGGESMQLPKYEDSPDTAMGEVNEQGEKSEKCEKNDKDVNSKDSCEAGPSKGAHCGSRWGRRGGPWGGRGGRHHPHSGPGGPDSFPWGRGPFPFGGGSPFGPIGEFMRDQFFGAGQQKNGEQQGDFKPELDVFDTEASFVVHISLPGAKKEDVGVNWDPEKSELSIAGVIYRPGDEDFIKTLAMDGRKIGPFEAKVRLGSRANPAQIEVDGITAKLEDGILIVEVPKQDKDYVEVKKVDIE